MKLLSIIVMCMLLVSQVHSDEPKGFVDSVFGFKFGEKIPPGSQGEMDCIFREAGEIVISDISIEGRADVEEPDVKSEPKVKLEPITLSRPDEWSCGISLPDNPYPVFDSYALYLSDKKILIRIFGIGQNQTYEECVKDLRAVEVDLASKYQINFSDNPYKITVVGAQKYSRRAKPEPSLVKEIVRLISGAPYVTVDLVCEEDHSSEIRPFPSQIRITFTNECTIPWQAGCYRTSSN